MQVFEQTKDNEWKVQLSPLSMESRGSSETEYRLSVYDDKSPQRSSSSSSSSSSINSSDSSSSSRSSSSSSNGTCTFREGGETGKRTTPWNSMDESLAALAALFEQQMQRRVSRRVAAAAAAAEAAETSAVPAAAAADATKLPVLNTNEFTLNKANAVIENAAAAAAAAAAVAAGICSNSNELLH
ncbi:hypothetical protein Emed_000839 [Eimeria media]